MKFEINKESKLYLLIVGLAVLAVFIISGVVFLGLVADKLDVVLSQNPKITYIYFISIMDKILVPTTIFVVIPVTFYQILSKIKSKYDKVITFISMIILFCFIFAISAGVYQYFKSYKNGDLKDSILFEKPSVETKIFDKIIH